MLEQFPEAILQIFSKNTRQEVQSTAQVTYGMLSYHFYTTQGEKGTLCSSGKFSTLLFLLPFFFFPPLLTS